MSNVQIRELTTSLIAVLIVVGGGAFILTQPENPFSLVVSGFIGAVVQKYLSGSTANEIAKVASTAATQAVSMGVK